MGSNSRLRGDSPERGHRARRVPARVNAGFGRPRRVVCGRRSGMLPLGSGCQGQSQGSRAQRRPRREEQGAPPPEDPVVASETPGERSPRRASAEPAAATRWRQSAAQRGRDRGCRCRGRRGAAGRAVPTPRGGSSPTRDACQCQADAGQGRERRAGTRRGCDVPGPGGGGAPGATASLRKPGGARGAHAASGGSAGSSRPHGGAPTCVPFAYAAGVQGQSGRGPASRHGERPGLCPGAPGERQGERDRGPVRRGGGPRGRAQGRGPWSRRGHRGPGPAGGSAGRARLRGALGSGPASWARTTPGRAEGRQGAKAGPRAASAAGELVLSGASGTALRGR